MTRPLPVHRYEVRIAMDKSAKSGITDPWWEVMRLDFESGKTIRVMGQWEFKHQALDVAKVLTKYARSEIR